MSQDGSRVPINSERIGYVQGEKGEKAASNLAAGKS